MKKVAVVLACCVFGALVLSGCSSGVKTGEASPGTSGVSVSATPSVTPSALAPAPTESVDAEDAYEPATPEHPAKNVPKPVMPKNARDETTQGQQAFIEYYFKLMNYAIESQDVTELASFSGEKCKLCRSVMGIALTNKNKGIYTVGKAYDPKKVNSNMTPDPSGIYHAFAIVDGGKLQAFKNGVAVGGPDPETPNVYCEVQLYRGKAGWYVNDLVPRI